MKTFKPSYTQFDKEGRQAEQGWDSSVLECITEVLGVDYRHGLPAGNPLPPTPALAILEMGDQETTEIVLGNKYIKGELNDFLDTHNIVGHRIRYASHKSLGGPELAYLFVVLDDNGVSMAEVVSLREFEVAQPDLNPKEYAKPLKKLSKAFRKLYGDCTDFTVRLSGTQPTEVRPWLQRNGQYETTVNEMDQELVRNPSLISLDVVAWMADAVGVRTDDTALAGRILLAYQGGTVVYKGLSLAPQPFSL